MQQNGKVTKFFNEFNDVQKDIFKKVFEDIIIRKEPKTELINPKSPKTPKLSVQEGQIAKKPAKKTPNQQQKKVASPKIKIVNLKQKISNSKQKRTNQHQNASIQPQVASIQDQLAAIQPQLAINPPNPATIQYQAIPSQSNKQEKFEFKKIQPQDHVQQDVGSKILKKILMANHNTQIPNLIIQNQFLYPEISILTAGSSQSAQNQAESLGISPSVSQSVHQAPEFQLIVPNNTSVNKDDFMTLYNSKVTQNGKTESAVTAEVPKVKETIFKVPDASKPPKKLLKDLNKPQNNRRKSNPEAPKQQQPKVPKRNSLGQKKSPTGTAKEPKVKKVSLSAKVNIYETPRRSFLVPTTKTDKDKGLRRGRSKFSSYPVPKPDPPRKGNDEITKDEFFDLLDLMKNN